MEDFLDHYFKIFNDQNDRELRIDSNRTTRCDTVTPIFIRITKDATFTKFFIHDTKHIKISARLESWCIAIHFFYNN